MPITVSPSGRQFVICRGAQTAVVTEAGATLREYRVGDRDVVSGFAAGEVAHGGRGQVLAPWPNRLAAGAYSFAGQSLQLPLSEPARGNAIHGLVRWLAWTPREEAPDRVRLGVRLPAQPGYPFGIDLELEYRLTAEGLAGIVRARRLESGPAPFGVGFHPYLDPGPAGVEGTELEIPAGEYLEVDERLVPTGRRLAVGELDFRHPRPVAGARLDRCFVLQGGHARFGATTLWWDSAFGYLQMFTGDTLAAGERRTALALEPMTCAPDAFNNGLGLLRLDGEWEAAWGISPASIT